MFRFAMGVRLSGSRSDAPSIRLSIRHYLWADDQLWRLSQRLHADLVSGRAALVQFANTRQRVIEVFVRRLRQTPLFVRARGLVYPFDAQGHLDLHEQVEAVPLGLEGREARRVGDNVFDAGPALRHRRWMQEHTWKPSAEVMRLIKADITGRKSIAILKP